MEKTFAFSGRARLPEEGGGSLAVHATGTDDIDEDEPNEDGGGPAEAIIQESLKAHTTDALVGAEVHHAGDDGRHNERHDQHLEGVHKEAAKEIADLVFKETGIDPDYGFDEEE